MVFCILQYISAKFYIDFIDIIVSGQHNIVINNAEEGFIWLLQMLIYFLAVSMFAPLMVLLKLMR
jgi:hypothetical protein